MTTEKLAQALIDELGSGYSIAPMAHLALQELKQHLAAQAEQQAPALRDAVDAVKNAFAEKPAPPTDHLGAARDAALRTVLWYYAKECGSSLGRDMEALDKWAIKELRKLFDAQAEQQARYDECPASGRTCEYGPHGPAGEMQCRYCGSPKQAEQQAPTGQRGFDAYRDDVRRLTREIDVVLNGEEGAAEQASLCDLVAQLRANQAELGSAGSIRIGLAVIRELTRTQQKSLEATIDAVRSAISAQAEQQATHDMLDDARAELQALREALGVPYEPHQTLQERTLEAAQALRSLLRCGFREGPDGQLRWRHGQGVPVDCVTDGATGRALRGLMK